MSSPRLVARSVRSWQDASACIFCSWLQFAPSGLRSEAARSSIRSSRRAVLIRSIGHTRAYATAPRQRLDVQKLRTDVDERARLGFYALNQQQGALHMDRVKANSIAKEFLAKQKTMDHGSNIKQLASSVFYQQRPIDLANICRVWSQHRGPSFSRYCYFQNT